MSEAKETKAEAMQRRQVEALEAIAEHLETLASVVEPAFQGRAADPDSWNPREEPAYEAYLRTAP